MAGPRKYCSPLPPPRLSRHTSPPPGCAFRDHAQVMGDQDDGRPDISSFSLSIRSRIWAWIVTSRAVVGSSAISRSGVAGQGHGDHHPLAHAAAQLMRDIRATVAPARGSPPVRASRRPGPGPPWRDSLWWSRIASTIWSPTVKTGLREVIGSWKIMEIWSPRILRIRSAAAPEGPAPRAGSRLPSIRPGGSGTSRRMERAVTLLPQPDSPTMPSVSPSCTLKSTPSTAGETPSSEKNGLSVP